MEVSEPPPLLPGCDVAAEAAAPGRLRARVRWLRQAAAAPARRPPAHQALKVGAKVRGVLTPATKGGGG